MPITLEIEALYILDTLQKAGFEAYIVGGAVRDMVRAATVPGTTVTDFDFTTNATPEEISALFPNSFYENTFGTVSVTQADLREQLPLPVDSTLSKSTLQAPILRVIDVHTASKLHSSFTEPTPTIDAPRVAQKNVYEITTFRTDGSYENHRHPVAVSWGKSLQEDLDRRDFTINALALSVQAPLYSQLASQVAAFPATVELTEESYQIIDKHNGITDLESGTIRTVGAATKRFSEDALRILRAIRFSVQLNMQIESDTYDAIIEQAPLLKQVSWERIQDEFLKMLASDYPREAIEILDDTGCLDHILPELLPAKGVEQGGHHTTDVWEHSLAALAHCPSTDPIVRLATLIHDIGKPDTFKVLSGKPTFYNHEIVGSRIAKSIARRLKLSKKQTDRLFILVRYHMFYYQPENTDASIRRFMRKVGLTNIDDILDLREGDRLGSGARKTSWRLEEMKQRMIEQLHQPFAITDMAINGTDLMEQLELQPGPLLGKILHELFEKVLENPELNSKESLLEEARALLAS